MPKIDESDLDVGNEPPFVARKVVIKKGQNPKNDYSFNEELGRGRFGTVLKCKEKKTGLELAAKFVSTRAREERENVEREVDIMKSLQHRRLMQLYDVYDDGITEMCIITELINGGELFERVIDDDFELTEKVCTIFMRQICEGVEYMHDKYIMHLDMKPENILCVTRMGNRVKLIDFGLARRYEPTETLQVMFGTPDFAAPEVLSYERVTPAADMWSVGVICYVLLSGLSPFLGNSDLETMTNVTRALYDFDDDSFDPISSEAKDFISKLLIKDPKRRLTPVQCLKHRWLVAKLVEPRGKATKLSKTKLKKYVVRRRWQKAVTAIMALSRMGANLALKNKFGASSQQQQQQQQQQQHQSAVSRVKSSTATSSSSSSSSCSGKFAAPVVAPVQRTSAASSSYSSQSTRSSSSASSATSMPVARTIQTSSYTSTSSTTRTSSSNSAPPARLAGCPASPKLTSLPSKPLASPARLSSAPPSTLAPSAVSPAHSARGAATSSSTTYRITSSTVRSRKY